MGVISLNLEDQEQVTLTIKEPQCIYCMGFPGGTVVKNLPADAGDSGSIPGLGRIPGEGMATHSSILVWKIPWGCKESDTSGHTHTHTHILF